MPQTSFIFDDDESPPIRQRPEILGWPELDDADVEDLPPGLVEELGRTLGTMFIQQYRADAARLVKPGGGPAQLGISKVGDE
jgi:hypothetical protein